MLAAMLESMDQRNFFDRTHGKRPFLLLDGHQSCIKLPYGTHLWQVGDSSEQNGSFKMALYKAKKNYLTYRDVDDQNEYSVG
jgi:hypothetical protein